MAKKKITEELDAVASPENAPKVKFEQWRMEMKNGKLEKLKMERDNVNITQETADILNAGAASPDAVNPIMYLLPGQNA